jgi:hypothetical protein
MEIFKILFLANITQPEYIRMVNNNMIFFIPYIKKDDWEFYGKFQIYSKKVNVPNDLKKKIDIIFE